MTIPVPLIVVILGTGIGGLLTFGAWLVRQIVALSKNQAQTAASLAAVADRVARLEGWQDGVAFGRAVSDYEHRET